MKVHHAQNYIINRKHTLFRISSSYIRNSNFNGNIFLRTSANCWLTKTGWLPTDIRLIINSMFTNTYDWLHCKRLQKEQTMFKVSLKGVHLVFYILIQYLCHGLLVFMSIFLDNNDVSRPSHWLKFIVNFLF